MAIFNVIDTTTDTDTGSVQAGSNIDVYNYGASDATIIVQGKSITITAGYGWSSGYNASGFGFIQYTAIAASRLQIITFD